MHIPFRLARLAALAPIVLGLAACKMEVLSPSGDVAERQRDLLVQSTWLMLLIIIPVMALTIWFAWRYRASNRDATYAPDWDPVSYTHLTLPTSGLV